MARFLQHPVFWGCSALGLGLTTLTSITRGPNNKSGAADYLGKTIVITGATSGVGSATALESAKRGAKVVLVAREPKRCRQIAKRITEATQNPEVSCVDCDLTSFASIRECAAQLNKLPRLDVLVNNAGVMLQPDSRTEDGHEIHIQTNYLGRVLLTHLLLPSLKRSQPSRVVNLACSSYKRGEIDLSDMLSCETNVWQPNPDVSTSASNLASILWTRLLAESLTDSGVTVNAVDPGLVSNYAAKERRQSWIALPIRMVLGRPPKKAAQTVLYASVNPEVTSVTGKLLYNCGQKELTPRAMDEVVAKRLWNRTMDVLRL